MDEVVDGDLSKIFNPDARSWLFYANQSHE